MKIVVAEDQETIRTVLERVLTRMGHSVTAYPSADEAATHTDKGVELVITDWDMPGMTGVEFASRIRSGQILPGANPSVILMSGGRTNELAGAVREHGLDMYLCKPFSVVDLKAAIEEIERRREEAGL